MADNSKRERIILDLIQAMESIPGIRKVFRRMPVDEAHLARIPGHHLPCVIVTAGLPIPDKWGDEEVISSLPVRLSLVGRDPLTPDETISDLLDEMWNVLMNDRKRNNLALTSDLIPEQHGQFAGPFFHLSLQCRIRYVHTVNGI